MRQQFLVFLIRLLFNMIGLWIAVRLFGGIGTLGVGTFLLAALLFSVVNAVVRPIIVILALPVIVLTLGLFTIIVNGLMVWLAVGLTPGLHMTFLQAIFTGLILSLVNYIVNSLVTESYGGKDYGHK